MKRKRISLVPRWLRRRPRATYVVCPNCQAVSDLDDQTADQVRQQVAWQALDAVAGVDALRRRKAAGDPIRNQLLADIEAGFIKNATDVGRRFRRAPGREEPS
jgi:hypothetical protein